MIWIIGGTSDTRRLLNILNRKDYIITLATEEGREFFPDENLKVGRLNLNEMGKFIENEEIKIIIDTSHPYAEIVSANARKISKKKDLLYLRYIRPKSIEDEDIIHAEDIKDLQNILKNIKGTVLFTTGSKNIPDFEIFKGDNRFIYRILPVKSSLEIAENAGVKIKDIICMTGPFSEEMNIATINEYKADYMVTKDSGDIGGTLEKLNAAKKTDTKLILLDRKKEKGYHSFQDIIKEIESYEKLL